MDTKQLRAGFVREHNRWARANDKTPLPRSNKSTAEPRTPRGNFPHHGLEKEQRLSLLASHSGLCDLCGQSSDASLQVDHCHDTGKIRGILCGPCNSGIAFFKDSVGKLKLAIAYLEQHPKE